MITREDYNKALDIVEAYHKQIAISGLRDNGKTKLYEWAMESDCSTRLRNALTGRWQRQNNPNYVQPEGLEYLEDVKEVVFMRIRNAGRKAWDEFVKLRGY